MEIQIGRTRRVQRFPNPSVEITRLTHQRFALLVKAGEIGNQQKINHPESESHLCIFKKKL